MSDKNLNKLLTFEAELSAEGKIKLPSDKLSELFAEGYKSVTVSIFDSSNYGKDKRAEEIELFGKIKNMQKLPDDVVIDFIKCRGKLKDKSFAKRIIN